MTMPISPEHAGELARLIEHEAKPDLILIGAVALGHHVPLGRHTSDVDLAVVVSLDDVAPLLGSLGWTRHATMPHRWHGPANFLADVLPVTLGMRSDDADERVHGPGVCARGCGRLPEGLRRRAPISKILQ